MKIVKRHLIQPPKLKVQKQIEFKFIHAYDKILGKTIEKIKNKINEFEQ